MALAITAWGVATAVRDGGRQGMAHLGRGRGGAADLAALQLANRLVGNEPDTAGLETSGGLTFRVTTPTMIAITGSPVDVQVEGGVPVGWGAPVAVGAGALVHLGRLHGGARTYVAVRGGIGGVDGPTVAVGPDPLVPASAVAAVPHPAVLTVRVWEGPRLDWFSDDAWPTLLGSTFTVLGDSNRVGVRLSGPALRRSRHGELPSEGLLEGSVQVPPSGQPIVMLADHPVTGGYPVIGVVDPADVGYAAQWTPGMQVGFRAAQR